MTAIMCIYQDVAMSLYDLFFFFSSRRRHTRFDCDWSSDVCSSDLERAEALRKDGQTVAFVSVDGQPAGLVGVSDPIKESTREAIRMLHEDGARIVMRSEEHTSELQSQSNLVCRLLLEKKKQDEHLQVLAGQQVDADWEVLVVGKGYTDGTADIVRRYAHNANAFSDVDPRMRV